MKQHILQRLIVSPRQSIDDPRIARTGVAERSIGTDGKLYTSIDQRDYGKYKVLSESELEHEMHRSQEMQSTIMSSNGKLLDGTQKKTYSPSKSSYSAPMFGIPSREKKMERKAWEADEDTTKGGPDTDRNMHLERRNGKHSNSETRLNARPRQPTNYSHHEEGIRIDDRENERRERSADRGDTSKRNEATLRTSRERDHRNDRGVSHSPASRSNYVDDNLDEMERSQTPVASVMSALKMKYEQNLDVIEKLFDEKQSMEKLLQNLDSQLTTARIELASPRPPTSDIEGRESFKKYRSKENRGYERGYDYEREGADKEERRKYERYDPDVFRREMNSSESPPRRSYRGMAEQRGTRHGLDSSSDFSTRPTTGPVRSSTPTFTASNGLSSRSPRRDSRMDDKVTVTRSHEDKGGAHSVSGDMRRSRSMSSDGFGYGISANLQADQDRYVQRRRAVEDKERELQVEERKFQEDRSDRYLRASKAGGEFTEMKARDEFARRSYDQKMEEKRVKEMKKKREEKNRAEKEKNDLLLRSKHREELSWAEMKELQERQKGERVKARVQELANFATGFEPSKGSEGLARQSAQKKMIVEPVKPAPVDDPEVVTARLLKQKQDWDDRLERIKERSRGEREKASVGMQRNAAMSTSLTVDGKHYHGTFKMVQRAVDAESKRLSKLADLKIKEDNERSRKAEHDRKVKEKLLNSKAPDESKRLTKKAAETLKLMRKKAEDGEIEQKKEKEALKKKSLSEKQHSEMMRTIVNERERDRRENYKGEFVELKQAQDDALSAQNRESYRNSLRANKKRIDQAKTDRPSLILRHDQEVAKTMAGSSALNKVAQAVLGEKLHATTGGQTNNKNRKMQDVLNEDDIFDENQKIVLGYKDDFDLDDR